MDPTDEDLVLMLAYGIDGYATVKQILTEMDAITGVVPWALAGQVRRPLREWAQQWWATVHGDPTWHDDYLDRVVAEAREWLATHQTELEELRELRSNE